MSIGINLQGEHGQLSAVTVRDTLSDLLSVLSDASRASGAGKQTWVIADLQVGSAIMAVSAPDELPVSALLRDGLAQLERAAAIPPRWTQGMVRRVAALGGRAGHGGATGISITGLAATPVTLSPEIVDHAERALGTHSIAYGSFRGNVDRWNQHNRREIGLTLDDDSTLPATYPSSLADRVRAEAIGHRIEVWGLVSRNPAGQAVSLAVDGFELLPETQPISAADMAGVYVIDGEPMVDLNEWMTTRGK